MARSHPSQQPPAPPPILEAAALHRAGKLADAAVLYRRILKKNPRDPDALHLLGLAVSQQGNPHEGLATIAKALQVRDDFPDAHSNASQIALQLGDLKLAEHHARRAVAYRRNATTYTSLGRVLRAQNRRDEALAAYKAAHECNPRDVEGFITYARSLRMTDDAETMLAVAVAGLQVSPDHPTLQLVTSEAHFALGQLQSGWRAYRNRFRSLENRIVPRTYALPMWQGEDLDGRTVLIWAEQGPGDEVMYANMYADVIARTRRCLIQCSPRLAPIIRRSFPTVEVFDRDLSAEELAGIDYQTPAASMGEWLRAFRQDFPGKAGYLKADPKLREELRARYLADDKDRLLVGVAWRSLNTNGAAEKSVSILDWGAILNVPGVTFVSLQYGECTQELNDASQGFRVPIVRDPSIDPLKDMDGFTAQVAAMDFVVSSSNTAAHVAGALGIPVFCMLPHSLDRGRRWYWLAQDGKTPWYPSMHLFTQREPGQWFDTIRDVGLGLLDAVAAVRDIDTARYIRSMSNAFVAAKRPDDAEILQLHMARDPRLAAEAYARVAELRRDAQDAAGVFEFCDRAIAADPGFWKAYNLKGLTLTQLHRFDEAIAVYKDGLAHHEHSHQLHNNLGKSLYILGRNQEALPHFERALQYAPSADAATLMAINLNYAAALHYSGEHDRALERSVTAIALSPESADAHYNYALILLSLGQLSAGWKEFAWRLKRPAANVRYDAFPHIRPWDGEPLAQKKILIWTEQGIGDEILTSTMFADAIDTAREVVILCSERLVPLFRRSFPRARVDLRETPLPASARATDFDFQMSMSDLGLAFRRNLGEFPVRPRTLIPDEPRRKAIRARYAARWPDNILVGLSWASPINQEMGWLKATQLETWKPILETPGVTFINLQYGDSSAARARIHASLGVEIFDDTSIDPLKDMDAYAAQVAAMDLVISTSNTLVHTAGALGVPTWVMVAEGRGRLWYWLKERSDTLWYSSVRLVRQEKAGDWTLPIARCAQDLRRLVQEKKDSGTP